ncbi:MAG: TIGR00153 family protein [Candidatus Thermoplasmatota archaeon]|nr:TIGR00153 family protein [Candidatus Thermoplasmatota archaeon]
MSAKFRRSTLEDALFDSPFDGLKKHSDLIKRAIKEFQRGVHFYSECEFEKAEEKFERVSKLEHEADKIKVQIRENLPRFIFMPITRDDFLTLLKEADAILDYAEDVAVLLPMREEEIPESVTEDFKKFSKKVFESVKQFDEMMKIFSELLESSFSKKSKEKARELQVELSEREHEADKIEKSISKKLFNYDKEPLTAVHLLKVVDRMDSIADHAENVGDMIDSNLESK